MRGLKIALEKFYEGACGEGYKAAMITADPAKSWQKCERADWMLWLLRRQCSVLDLKGPVRDVVRVFEQFISDLDEGGPFSARTEEEKKLRMALLEHSADRLRAYLPNPFTPEGYDWLVKGEHGTKKTKEVGTWWCNRCNQKRGKQSDWEFIKLENNVGFYRCVDCGSCVCACCYKPIDQWYEPPNEPVG